MSSMSPEAYWRWRGTTRSRQLVAHRIRMATLLRHGLRTLRAHSASRLRASRAIGPAAVLGLSAGLAAQQHTAAAAAAAAAAAVAAAPAPVRVVYEEHHVGEGAVVESGETVHVHYEGRLDSFDGPVFDSSYAKGEPLIFIVDESPVIQGWHDGVRGMRVGGRRKLTVPAELGYGSKGIKDPARNRWVIPPNSTLYFRCACVAPGLSLAAGSVAGWHHSMNSSCRMLSFADRTGCAAQVGSSEYRCVGIF